MQYLILSFGGAFTTSDDDAKFNKAYPRITHHVVDRPLTGLKLDSTKEYVQP